MVIDGGVRLQGDLEGPRDAPGLVIFAHGSGSSRRSPRNPAGRGPPPRDGRADPPVGGRADGCHGRFDIGLLAARLAAVTERSRGRPGGLQRIGYFGASTGAAAALFAAADLPEVVSAIVSRGGRFDLAERALDRVVAPTLLIVGELDRSSAN